MLLVVGLVMGVVMWAANLFPPVVPPADPHSQLFFLLLLPLILFPGAYYLDAKTFLARWEVRCSVGGVSLLSLLFVD